jgi:hypothetical protein
MSYLANLRSERMMRAEETVKMVKLAHALVFHACSWCVEFTTSIWYGIIWRPGPSIRCVYNEVSEKVLDSS